MIYVAMLEIEVGLFEDVEVNDLRAVDSVHGLVDLEILVVIELSHEGRHNPHCYGICRKSPVN